MTRAIVFAHYDCDDLVDEYVYHYLNELNKNAKLLVFISTSKLSDKDISRLSEYCSNIIIRPNIGYDFMSYKVGLESFNHTEFDEIVICNDSVYAPLFSLEHIFNEMANCSVDFWGATDNNAYAHHLQSYFIVFKKAVISSAAFKKFWQEVIVLPDKDSIIQKYEVGLSVLLMNNGFRFKPLYNYVPNKIVEFWLRLKRITFKKMIMKIFALCVGKYDMHKFGTMNNTHFFWKKMLEVNIPFLKIELLRDNPCKIDITDIYAQLEMKSNYDVNLIKNHLTRIKK